MSAASNIHESTNFIREVIGASDTEKEAQIFKATRENRLDFAHAFISSEDVIDPQDSSLAHRVCVEHGCIDFALDKIYHNMFESQDSKADLLKEAAASGQVLIIKNLLQTEFTLDDRKRAIYAALDNLKLNAAKEILLNGKTKEECSPLSFNKALHEFVQSTAHELISLIRTQEGLRRTYYLFLVLQSIQEDSFSGLLAHIESQIVNYLSIYAFKLPEFMSQDKKLLLPVIQKRPRALMYAHEDLKKDKEIVLAAVLNDGLSLQYAGVDLKKDKEVAIAAVKQNGYALEYVHPDLRNDKEVVLEAVNKYGSSLKVAGDDLKKEREVALAAVKQNGLALEYVHPDLRKDKEVVFAALKQNVTAFVLANPDFKKDKEVVLEAVHQNGYALQYAHADLKKDEEVVLAALMQDWDCLQYAHADLINHSYFREKFIEQVLKKTQCPQKIIDFLIRYKNFQIRDFLIRNIQKAYHQGKSSYINERTDPSSNTDIAAYLSLISLSTVSEAHIQREFIESTIGRFKKHFKDGPKAQALFQFLSILIKEGLPDRANKMEIFQRCFEKEEIDEVLSRLKLVSLYLQVYHSPPAIYELSYLKDLFTEALISNGVLDKADKQAFCDKFISSRDPVNLLHYINTHMDDPWMHKHLAKFIVDVCRDQFIALRNENNSHKDFLTLEQKAAWEAGATKSLKQGQAEPFNIKAFLTQKIVTDNHGGEVLNALKAYLTDGTVSSSAKDLESMLINLITSVDMKDIDGQKHLLGLIEEESKKETYRGIEFLNDIKALKEGLNPKAPKEVVLRDSEDWQDLIFAGTEVQGSCQRLDGDPDLNKCLLGYVLDGKCRIITMKAIGSDKIESRAIIKLLKDKDNKPVIFLERVYPVDSDEIKNFAKERAGAIGLSIYSNEGDEELHSDKVAAPFEYEDGGIGVSDTGSYIITAKKLL